MDERGRSDLRRCVTQWLSRLSAPTLRATQVRIIRTRNSRYLRQDRTDPSRSHERSPCTGARLLSACTVVVRCWWQAGREARRAVARLLGARLYDYKRDRPARTRRRPADWRLRDHGPLRLT